MRRAARARHERPTSTATHDAQPVEENPDAEVPACLLCKSGCVSRGGRLVHPGHLWLTSFPGAASANLNQKLTVLSSVALVALACMIFTAVSCSLTQGFPAASRYVKEGQALTFPWGNRTFYAEAARCVINGMAVDWKEKTFALDVTPMLKVRSSPCRLLFSGVRSVAWTGNDAGGTRPAATVRQRIPGTAAL